MDPFQIAKNVFADSLESLMAHTIRGTENHFRKNHLELDVKIIPDNKQTILKDDSLVYGILRTRMLPKQYSGTYSVRGRVDAAIFIHKNATKEMARFTIAHEIYHLLLELEQWKKEKLEWKSVEITTELENDCHAFAQALCYLHDHMIYRDQENRKKHVHFKDELFESAIRINGDGSINLPEYLKPEPINSSPDVLRAFWQAPKPDFQNIKFPWV